MAMKNPPHPGDLIRTEIIEPGRRSNDRQERRAASLLHCLTGCVDGVQYSDCLRRLGLHITPADCCAIVRTDARELRDGRLHFVPVEPAVVEARLQYHSGASIAHAIEMHLVTVYLDKTARWKMRPQIIRALDRLIEGSNDSQQYNEACQSSKKISDPPKDAALSRSTPSTTQRCGLVRHVFLSTDTGEKEILGGNC